jgi:hypothetical protein
MHSISTCKGKQGSDICLWAISNNPARLLIDQRPRLTVLDQRFPVKPVGEDHRVEKRIPHVIRPLLGLTPDNLFAILFTTSVGELTARKRSSS